MDKIKHKIETGVRAKRAMMSSNSILCIKQGMNGFMCEAAIDKTRWRRSARAERDVVIQGLARNHYASEELAQLIPIISWSHGHIIAGRSTSRFGEVLLES